jgi:hypothetical protein
VHGPRARATPAASAHAKLWAANAPHTCGNLAIVITAACCLLVLVAAFVMPFGLVALERARAADPLLDFVKINECEVHGADSAGAAQNGDECIDSLVYNFTTRITSTSPPPPFFLVAAPAAIMYTSAPEQKSRGVGTRCTPTGTAAGAAGAAEARAGGADENRPPILHVPSAPPAPPARAPNFTYRAGDITTCWVAAAGRNVDAMLTEGIYSCGLPRCAKLSDPVPERTEQLAAASHSCIVAASMLGTVLPLCILASCVANRWNPVKIYPPPARKVSGRSNLEVT